MRRYVQLGQPIDPEFDREDAAPLAETKIVLAEMKQVQGQIDALLGCKQH
jgi:hypothetical protein